MILAEHFSQNGPLYYQANNIPAGDYFLQKSILSVYKSTSFSKKLVKKACHQNQ